MATGKISTTHSTIFSRSTPNSSSKDDKAGSLSTTATNNTVSKKQRTVDDYIVRQRVTPSKAKHITKLICNVIVGDLRPVNLVEGNHFQKLIKELAAGYELPSGTTFTRRIEDSYLECKQKIINRLKVFKNISLTTDMWTNINNESFLGITAHSIDATTFSLHSYVLATKQVMDSHTGDNLVTWIEQILEDFEVSPYQVDAVVSDN